MLTLDDLDAGQFELDAVMAAWRVAHAPGAVPGDHDVEGLALRLEPDLSLVAGRIESADGSLDGTILHVGPTPARFYRYKVGMLLSELPPSQARTRTRAMIESVSVTGSCCRARIVRMPRKGGTPVVFEQGMFPLGLEGGRAERLVIVWAMSGLDG